MFLKTSSEFGALSAGACAACPPTTATLNIQAAPVAITAATTAFFAPFILCS
jgi:hypothetical protein